MPKGDAAEDLCFSGEAGSGRLVNSQPTVIGWASDGALSAFVNILPRNVSDTLPTL